MTPRQYVLQQLIQVAILIGTLGLVLCLIGFYPGITGVEPRSGIGVLQIMIILFGISLIILGAFIFVKVGFFPDDDASLLQRIAVRVSLTGLLVSAAAGLSDLLGYGSNPPEGPENIPILGPYQVAGMLFGFLIASGGVLLYVMVQPAPKPPQELDIESLLDTYV